MLSVVPVKPFRIAEPDVVLLVTGGTNGMLEVCNCAGPMPGGLARRSGLVRSYRAAFPNTFVIDTGDVFWVEPNDLRNEFVLKGYAAIGYDAVALGDQEWAAGPTRLAKLDDTTGLTFLATTVDANGAQFPPVATCEAGGVKLAVVSDVRDSAFRFVPRELTRTLRVAKPGRLAQRVRRLKQDGFVVVSVAHMEADSLPGALAEVDADLVLQAHTSRPEEKLRRVAGKPVVKVGGYETVGAVALKIDGSRIADLDYRLEIVNKRWPLDRRLILTYQAYAHAAMRQALDAERKEGLAYVPSATCGRCHRKQYSAWQSGPHSRAYKTLVRAKRTGAPNCLACHTTGFGMKGGFYTIEKTPQLAGVNCQNCHRHGVAEHHTSGFVVRRVTKDVCTTCHTPVTAPKFDFAKSLPKVQCPKGLPGAHAS